MALVVTLRTEYRGWNLVMTPKGKVLLILTVDRKFVNMLFQSIIKNMKIPVKLVHNNIVGFIKFHVFMYRVSSLKYCF